MIRGSVKLFYTGPVINAEMLVVMLEKHGIPATQELVDDDVSAEDDLSRPVKVSANQPATMKAVAMAPLTVDDYRVLPEGGPRYQLIEGDLFTAPAPNRYHQDISGNLHLLLGKYLEKHPIGKLYAAPFDVYLDDVNVHQPDLVFVSNRNKSILTHAGTEGAPDLVIEILSPKTAELDKRPKRRVFARAGVKELWIIEPDAKLIHVYQLQKDAEHPAASFSEKDTFSSKQFPGLKIKGANVFKR
jgi:Uma2 family endonuclease